jgi:hypothetical protein
MTLRLHWRGRKWTAVRAAAERKDDGCYQSTDRLKAGEDSHLDHPS